ncbi:MULTISPECIES: hypothetical protein [unclassified Curtobacterium]|uniref:hypothetical protein n=1 Tax=unclassified Curtobacterium TaxID=257496 RepID=UPI00382C645F
MTTTPPGNDPGTPIHDRTAAAEGHEIRPGVTVPSWADTTPLDDGRDADIGAPADSHAPPVASHLPPAAPADSHLPPAAPATPTDTGDDGSDAKATGDAAKAKADAAKGAAKDTAADAKEQASKVAGTAKEQAQNVAAELSDHARQIFGEASGNLKEQAADQQQRAAGGLRSLSDQLSRMADNDDEQGLAARVVRDLSGRAHSVAGYLDDRDPGSLLDEVKTFAAKRPGTFIAIAAGAGILAGRLTKALTAEAKHEKEHAQEHEAAADHASPSPSPDTTSATGVGTVA